jgi:hypothetical protein
VATESPPHCLSAETPGLFGGITYNTISGTESDSTEDGKTDNSEFDDRVSEKRFSVGVIFV